MRGGWGKIFLLSILALAAAIRFYGLGRDGFWQDEFLSLKDSSGQTARLESLPTDMLVRGLPHLTRLDPTTPWWRLWGPVDCEIQPPLYYLLLHGWREAFGDSEFAVRSFSVVASLAGLYFFYKALRIQGSGVIALWGTALLAVAFPQINAAQNARDYTLWMALAMGAAYALLLIEHRSFSWRCGIALGACTLAMLSTHYFAAFSGFSLGLYALIRLRGRARLATVGILLTAAMIFLILWGRQMSQQDHSGVGWLADHSLHPELQTLLRIVRLPLLSLSVVGNNLLASALFLAFLCIGLICARGDRRILFWIVWLIPLCACAIGVDWVHHLRMLEVSRYTFVGTASFCALLPMLSQRIFGRHWLIAIIAIFVVALASVPWAYPPPTEWKSLAEFFRAQARKGDVMVYTGGDWNNWEPFILYLGIDHYAPDLPADFVLLRDIHAPVIRPLPSPGKSVWMVCYEIDLSPEDLFPKGRVVQETLLPNVGRVSQVGTR